MTRSSYSLAPTSITMLSGVTEGTIVRIQCRYRRKPAIGAGVFPEFKRFAYQTVFDMRTILRSCRWILLIQYYPP